MLWQHGSIVEIVYGSNIPLLLRALHNQLELEELCETGSVTRELYDFDEPLPFEMAEIERKRAEEEVRERRFELQKKIAEIL